MKKRKKIGTKLAAFVIAFTFIVSGLFGGLLTPLQNYGAHASDHNIITQDGTQQSLSIEHLPFRTYEITSPIPHLFPRVTNGFFALYRRVGTQDRLIGVGGTDARNVFGQSELVFMPDGITPNPDILYIDPNGPALRAWNLPGNYVYRFYTRAEFERTTEHIRDHGPRRPVHNFTTTVTTTHYTIGLPENSSDILPNITVPNHVDQNPRRGTGVMTSETLPIVFPLPKTIYDTQARNILGLDDADTRQDALDALESIFVGTGPGFITQGQFDMYVANSDFDALRNLVWNDMTITFFGNVTTESSVNTWIDGSGNLVHSGTGGATQTTGIAHPASRTFVPTGTNQTFYAEYSFTRLGQQIRASYRTSNIIVEAPRHTPPATIRDDIRFEARPSMSFAAPNPTQFMIGSPTTLPVPSMVVYGESRAQFERSNTTTITSYTYIIVRFYQSGVGWRLIGMNDDGDQYWDHVAEGRPAVTLDTAMRIENFTFTPQWIGMYEFVYFTTTIFGVGERHASGVLYHTYQNRTFVRHYPFDPMVINRHGQGPGLRWTAQFAYDAQGRAVEVDNMGLPTTTQLNFDRVVDHSNYLPGVGTGSRTQLNIVPGEGVSLFIPALLGETSAPGVASNQINYQLRLFRFDQNNVRIEQYIMWSSGYFGADVSRNGGVWYNERPFTQIHFPDSQLFGTTDFLGGAGIPNVSTGGTTFAGQNVAGRYEVVIRAFNPPGSGGAGNTMTMSYIFDVVRDMENSRPRFSGNGLVVSQREFRENNTVRFRTVHATDRFTADRNIEIVYYVSRFEDGRDITMPHGVGPYNRAVRLEHYPSRGMTISGGVVSFEINRNYAIGRYILADNTVDHQAIHIFAIARNYHALTRIDDQGNHDPVRLGDPGATVADALSTIHDASHSDFVPFIAASFDTIVVYKIDFGSAALIRDLSHINTNLSWGALLADEARTMQGRRIYIPGLEFGYEANESFFSTISFEVIHQRTGTPARMGSRAQNVSFQDNVGQRGTDAAVILGRTDAAGVPDGPDTRRFFESNNVGTHLVIVRISNPGGNFGIFVGTVEVRGIPQHSARLLHDGRTTMRIGEAIQVPTVAMTIDTINFVSGGGFDGAGRGSIVSAPRDIVERVETSPGSGTWVPWPRENIRVQVGEYTVSGSGRVHMDGNRFIPTEVGTYEFIFTITVYGDGSRLPNGDPRYHDYYDPGTRLLKTIPASQPIRLTLRHFVTVGNLQPGDVIMDMMFDEYNQMAEMATLKNIEDPNFDPREVNRHNFFTPMTITGNYNSAMDMAQLLSGMEPAANSALDSEDRPTQWQYGRIFLPNEDLRLNNYVIGINDIFTSNDPGVGAQSFITVQHQSRGTTRELLNTRTDVAISGGFDDEVGMFYFRPQGRLYAQFDDAIFNAELAGNLTPTEEEFMAAVFASVEGEEDRHDWNRVGGTTGQRPDGQYIITYTVTFKTLTVTRTFRVAIGCVAQPQITYLGTTFDSERRVGDRFEFSFGENTFRIDGTRDPSSEWFWDGFRGSVVGDNIIISITRNGTAINEYDDSYVREAAPTIPEQGGDPARAYVETHAFTLIEAGTYTITIDVMSDSGEWGRAVYTITVNSVPPARQIAPEEVWGTILIILSSALLIGVVIYFFRTGQSTKFSSNKVKKKGPEEKPDVV